MLLVASIIINIIVLCVIFFVIFNEFKGRSFYYKMTIEDIQKIYVINMKNEINRRHHSKAQLQKYLIKDNCIEEKTIFFKATDGSEDLVFKNIKNNETFTSNDILNGKKQLQNQTTYKIYDKNHPDIFINYNNKYKNSNQLDRTHHFNRTNLTIGEISAILSHLNIMYDIIKNDYVYSIVLEDDFEFIDKEKTITILDKYLERTPYKFDILKLDKCRKRHSKFAQFKTSIFLGNNLKWFSLAYHKSIQGGSVGYLISLNGAKRILNFLMNEYIFDFNDSPDLTLFTYLPRFYGFIGIYSPRNHIFIKQQDNIVSSVDKINKFMQK